MLGVTSKLTMAPRLMGLVKPRNMSLMSAPPRKRIPFYEKAMFGVLLYASIISVPFYISSNIKHYKQGMFGSE